MQRKSVQNGPALHFDRVSLRLGSTEILQDVSLQVAAGSLHALAGPNGGGKSSLVKALLGQLPHRGQIRIDWPGDAPGVVAYVPQSLAFDPGLPMTVDDFMAAMVQRRPVFQGLAPAWRQPVAAALARVGLLDRRSRRMGALSGGERQRVLLAQALIPAPALVLLDEPMAALDEAGEQVFEQLLTSWRAAGVSVLWIEHDLAAVRRLADRVTGLSRHVLFDDTPAVALTPERLLDLFSQRPRSVREPLQ